MNKNKRSIVNWILIAMMVMFPLRSVIAIDLSTCEMHDEAAQEVMDHSMHMMHTVTEDAHMDTDASMNCCLDSEDQCATDCGMGMNVSIITPSAIALPALNETALRTHIISDLVFRDLTPPIRPPAYL